MAKKPKLKKSTILTIIALNRRSLIDSQQQRLFFTAVFTVLVAGLALQVHTIQASKIVTNDINRKAIADIYKDYGGITPKIRQLQDAQTKSGITVADAQTIQNDISPIYYYAENDDPAAARRALIKLQKDLTAWQSAYDKRIEAQNVVVASRPVVAGLNFDVPILIYHKTPADFDQQLGFLQAHGYTAITPHDLVAALHQVGSLPAKPVIITYDDGFSDQFTAFHLLQKYNMKATFYIINGGEASHWCIGANRHADQPCGDAYLTWDEVRMLDQSGLINIGGHTIDHLNLPTLSIDQQRQQIVEGKAEIEQQLGHPILDFAYPYGSFNAASMNIARAAGYESAVSTIPGTQQGTGNLYSLYRIRDPYKLP